MILKDIFDQLGWDWYGFCLWRDRFLGHRKVFTGLGIGLFVLVVVWVGLPRDRIYRNPALGYQITVPRGWRLKLTRDRMSATLIKKIPFYRGRAQIRIKMEMGNPYGQNAFAYLYNGILPGLRDTYGAALQFEDLPYDKERNGLPWGMTSFWLDQEVFYMIWVTVVNDNAYVVTLEAKGQDQLAIEKEFIRIMHSFRVEEQNHVNVFLEKDLSKDPGALFPNPLR